MRTRRPNWDLAALANSGTQQGKGSTPITCSKVIAYGPVASKNLIFIEGLSSASVKVWIPGSNQPHNKYVCDNSCRGAHYK